MSQWELLAQNLNHPSEKEMWRELYTNRKLSLSTLGVKFATAPHTIRARLVHCGIPLRSRGGPNASKIQVDQTLLDQILKMGVPKTAKLHGVTPQTLYTKLYYVRGLRKRDLDKIAREEAERKASGTDEPQTLIEGDAEGSTNSK